jgi:hypothetical protein
MQVFVVPLEGGMLKKATESDPEISELFFGICCSLFTFCQLPLSHCLLATS